MNDTPPFVAFVGNVMSVAAVIGTLAVIAYTWISGMISWLLAVILFVIVIIAVVQTANI